MIDVAAIDQLGLAGWTEVVTRRSPALRVVAGDREIATIAGPHTPGRPAPATGDPRTRCLDLRRTIVDKRQHDARERRGRTRFEDAGRIGKGGVLGKRRMHQASGAQHHRHTYHKLPSFTHTGFHERSPQFTSETGSFAA